MSQLSPLCNTLAMAMSASNRCKKAEHESWARCLLARSGSVQARRSK